MKSSASTPPAIDSSLIPHPSSLPAGTAPWWLRVLFVVVGLAAWFWTQSLIGNRPAVPIIGDNVHDLLASANAYLREHSGAANALLIVSSAIIDAMGVFLLAMSVFGKTVRPFLGLLLLFGMRQICQLLCALPQPPDMIWKSPGVPTLLVTYEVATDYFFSGHTGLAVLGAVELARLGDRRWFYLGIVIVIFESLTVLILRAHYTMDVLTGLIAAHYAAIMAARWAPSWDRLLARIGGRSFTGARGEV